MKKMTEQNLRAAFAGESQAHMRYLIFSEKAEKEKKTNLARLFKAISFAEQVHATNHYRALGEIRDSSTNLQEGIDGETYEVEEMYPAYKAVAELQKEQSAVRTTNYALEAEKIHEEMITESTTVSELRKALNEGGRVEVQLSLPRWPFNPWVRTVGNGVREVLVRGLLRIWVEMRVEGMERLKDLRRPAIFIFNHTDDFDGPVIYQAMPHRIRKRLTVAAADDVLREHKFLAFIIRFCFAGFNLSRKEPYMPSLEYVGQMMDAGWSVVLSPEGSLSKTGELQPFKSGIGLLAVELGVPIVPIKTVGLSGTVPLHAKWPKKHSKVVVHVGPPVTFGPKERYDEVASRLHQIMEML